MTTIVVGPDLTGLRERAKSLVMSDFVRRVELDSIPPTMRAVYVLKAAEARNVLLGERSEWISEEARGRGVSDEELARSIVGAMERTYSAEMERVRVNRAIDRASSSTEIVSVLAELGLALSIQM